MARMLNSSINYPSITLGKVSTPREDKEPETPYRQLHFTDTVLFETSDDIIKDLKNVTGRVTVDLTSPPLISGNERGGVSDQQPGNEREGVNDQRHRPGDNQEGGETLQQSGNERGGGENEQAGGGGSQQRQPPPAEKVKLVPRRSFPTSSPTIKKTPHLITPRHAQPPPIKKKKLISRLRLPVVEQESQDLLDDGNDDLFAISSQNYWFNWRSLCHKNYKNAYNVDGYNSETFLYFFI